MLLGCLFKQPSLLAQSQYPLTKNDFSENKFHQIMYLCVSKLYNAGCQKITPIEIDNVLQSHPVSLEIANDNDYMSFVETTKELSTLENYELYYNTVRKFTLLRRMKEKGHSIKQFYDEMEDREEEQLSHLSKFSIQDILNADELINIELRSEFDVKFVRDEMKAGENTAELIAKFREQPKFGACLQSPYLTTLFQGWCRGHLLLRSAPSETGKSRFAVGDLCTVGAKYWWNDEAQDFLDNPNYQGPTFFIHTEMDTEDDINTMFLACISGVEYRSIRNPSRMTKKELLRVEKAGQILLDSNITLVNMPDFTNGSIERKIKELVESEGVTYGVFDYLELQGALSAEYKNLTNMPIREDLVLKNSSAVLKYLAETYNVGLMSMTQLNDNWKSMAFPDNSCLSGGKSLINKLDGGSIIIKTKERAKEVKLIEPYLHRQGFGKDSLIRPNTIEYIYKARFNPKDNDKIKIWSNFNRGTFRRTDFFCTDVNDQIISVERTIPRD